MNEYPLYSHPDIRTLTGLISARSEKAPEDAAFRFTKKNSLVTKTYRQFLRDTAALAAFLQTLDHTGRAVAILSENSYDWILTFFAAVCGSDIAVPLDKELSTEELGGLLRRFDSPVLVCSESYRDTAEALKDAGCARQIVSMVDYPKILQEYNGDGHWSLPVTDEDAVCSVFFTSGTTGQPKGVMLTQKNLMLDAVNACRNLEVRGSSLLTLPLHHTFGFTVGVLAEMVYGYPVYISRGLRHFRRELREFAPQNLILVPLYVETMYKSIWKTAREEHKERKLKALIVLSRLLKNCGIDVRRKLFRSLLESFGGKLEEIVCGGARLEQQYVEHHPQVDGRMAYNQDAHQAQQMKRIKLHDAPLHICCEMESTIADTFAIAD